ncbi:hypothetical protein B0H11DRAFT_1941450 [Mycena galericulata]|nr:hypothetical protein B0H11DRAFT_1941450 [Mycena galericulata]
MKPPVFDHWSPVATTIIRWTPVEIAGERGRGGPVKTSGDRRNRYLILALTGTPRQTLSINICQWPPRVTGGPRRPPVTFPAAGILLVRRYSRSSRRAIPKHKVLDYRSRRGGQRGPSFVFDLPFMGSGGYYSSGDYSSSTYASGGSGRRQLRAQPEDTPVL